jgi:hypothetical protein
MHSEPKLRRASNPERLVSLVLALIAFSTAGFAQGDLEAPEPELIAVQTLPGPLWPGGQIIQATSKGEVRLLQLESLEVYSVDDEGLSEETEKLMELPSASSGPSFILGAALSPDGRQWLLQAIPPFSGVRLFRDEEEERLPVPPYHVTGVGYQGDTPVISVTSIVNSGPGVTPAEARRDESPVLLSLERDKWIPYFVEPSEEIDPSADRWLQVHAPRELRITAGRDRTLWFAQRNAYRVRQLSPSGRVRKELSLDDGEVVLREKSSEEKQRLVEDSRHAPGSMPTGFVETLSERDVPVRRIAAIGQWSGQLFILARNGGEGYWLDRYDPVLNLLERVELSAPGYSGTVSMALGRRGLFVVEYAGDANRWWIPWEKLEAAHWLEVVQTAK